MSTPLQSLIAAGTKVWLDSIDPDEIARNRAWGATGATSNPIIVSDLIKTGRFDDAIRRFLVEGMNDEQTAWKLTDMLVRRAQEHSCRHGNQRRETTATSASSWTRSSKTRQ